MKIAIKTEPNKEKLILIQSLGYKFIEIYTSRSFLQPEYLKLLKEFSFEYSVHAPVQYCDETVFNYANKLNAKTVTIHCVYTKKELENLSNQAASLGISLCIENEGVFGENNYEHDLKKSPELVTIHCADDFDRVGLPKLSMTLDVEHSGMRKSTNSFWRLVKNGIVKHMHISGYDGTKNSWHSSLLNNPERVSEIVGNLLFLDYQNMLTIEFHQKYHTEEVMRANLQLVSQCLPSKDLIEIEL